MKLLLKLFGLLFLVAIIAVVAIVVLVDVNEYKPQIEQGVEDATGRELDIGGEIGLSLWPLGIELGEVELSNADSFKEPVFARIESLIIKIDLLPLISGELKVDALSLIGLWLFLEVDEQGRTNWQDLAASGGDAGTPQADEVVEEHTGGEPAASPLAALQVSGIEILDADIQLDNRQQGSMIRVSKFKLVTGEIRFDEAFDVSMAAGLEHRQGDEQMSAEIDLGTMLTMRQDLQHFELDKMVLEIRAHIPAVQEEVMEMSVATDIVIDLAAQNIAIKDADIDTAYARLMLDANLADWQQAMKATGRLRTGPLNPRELAYRFATELPSMQGEKTLSHLKLDAPFVFSDDTLSLEPKIEFDESYIDGDIGVRLGEPMQVRYQLAMNQLDVNRYLPPLSEGVAEADAAEVTEVPETDLPIPAELIRSLDVQGTFRLGKVLYQEYEVTDIVMTVKAADGVAKISPLSMNALEGSIESHATLDVRKDVPGIKAELKVSGVQVRDIANPIVAALVPTQQIDVTGTGEIDVDVSSNGKRISILRKNLDGRAVIDMGDVIADGLDVEYLVSTTVNDFLDWQKASEKFGLATEYRPKTETAFEKIHASFTITDGVATTSDLLLDSSRIDVTGKGWVDVGKETLDMDIVSDLTLYKVSSVADKLADEPLPMKLSGPWTAIKFDPDFGPMKRRFKQEYLDKASKRVEKKTDAAKQKVEDRVKDKLKSLFR